MDKKPTPYPRHRCKTGLLFWNDIDDAVIEFKRRRQQTGTVNRNGITVSLERYFRHVNGTKTEPPCQECGGYNATRA